MELYKICQFCWRILPADCCHHWSVSRSCAQSLHKLLWVLTKARFLLMITYKLQMNRNPSHLISWMMLGVCINLEKIFAPHFVLLENFVSSRRLSCVILSSTSKSEPIKCLVCWCLIKGPDMDRSATCHPRAQPSASHTRLQLHWLSNTLGSGTNNPAFCQFIINFCIIRSEDLFKVSARPPAINWKLSTLLPGENLVFKIGLG